MKTNPEREPVAHYASDDGIECIDVIKSRGWLEHFALGNVYKYLWRAGHKENNTKLGDLKKARTYLDFAIQELENQE